MATHKWHLVASDEFRKQLNNLPKKELIRVFQRMKQLLEVDNPQSIVGVKKLVSVKPPQWRARQGVYRIIFVINSEEITVNDFDYKGTIEFLAVLHRKDAYRP